MKGTAERGCRPVQAEHVGVRTGRARARPGAGGDDREQHDQQQIGWAGAVGDVGRSSHLDHADLELAAQAEHRNESEQRLRDEAGRQSVFGEFADRRGDRALKAADAQRIDADGDESDEFDQRFDRDREHHAVVVFGRVDAARAEQDCKHRQQRGDVQRAVAQQRGGVRCAAAEHADTHRDRLELQRDIRNRGEYDDRQERRQDIRLAEARGDEIGDRGDVALLGDDGQTVEQTAGEREQQDRSEIDRQVRQARSGRGADRAVERPGRTIDGERQAIDERAQPGAARAAAGTP